MTESTISFTHQRKKRVWKVRHNLDEYGENVENAFVSWSVRTMVFRLDDFCKYVVSKNPGIFKCNPV